MEGGYEWLILSTRTSMILCGLRAEDLNISFEEKWAVGIKVCIKQATKQRGRWVEVSHTAGNQLEHMCSFGAPAAGVWYSHWILQ